MRWMAGLTVLAAATALACSDGEDPGMGGGAGGDGGAGAAGASGGAAGSAGASGGVPLYGLFETEVTNPTTRIPFSKSS